jgi:hypothetical protein
VSVRLKDPNQYIDLSKYFEGVQAYSDWKMFAFTETAEIDALRARIDKALAWEYYEQECKPGLVPIAKTIILSLCAEFCPDDDYLRYVACVVTSVLSVRWWMQIDAK